MASAPAEGTQYAAAKFNLSVIFHIIDLIKVFMGNIANQGAPQGSYNMDI